MVLLQKLLLEITKWTYFLISSIVDDAKQIVRIINTVDLPNEYYTHIRSTNEAAKEMLPYKQYDNSTIINLHLRALSIKQLKRFIKSHSVVCHQKSSYCWNRPATSSTTIHQENKANEPVNKHRSLLKSFCYKINGIIQTGKKIVAFFILYEDMQIDKFLKKSTTQQYRTCP